jgi:hypothetical protein
LPAVSLTPAANLPPVLKTPAVLVAKFADSVVDTNGKLATGVVDTRGKFAAGVLDTGGKFATGVVDASGAPWLANISAIFEKFRNDPKVIFRGLGEDDSWQKPEAKYLVTLSLLQNLRHVSGWGVFRFITIHNVVWVSISA